MVKLFFASLFTLTILSSFVFGIVILLLLYIDQIDIGLAISLTIGINFILWLIGPTITDLINKWFYKVKFVSKEELAQQHPEVAQIIEQVSTQYKFRFPKIGIILDKNPTAFTYGSARFNARIVLTEGIFHFLNSQGQRAVVAHELGHIVNRDFVVMMVASTLVQILYEIYAVLNRARGKKSEVAKLIALAAYVLYIVGIYLLYYLSRTREYLADAFSAKVTEPNDLSNALIKIAYGIVVAEDDDRTKQLLQSTRHLGIIDVKNAKHYGIISYITHDDPNVLSEVMVFDKVNPWAKLAELNSTHPLTGNRIDHLSDISKAQGRPSFFDINSAIERMRIDKGKLWGSFFFGLLILLLPYLLALYALFFLPIVLLPVAFALGLILQLPYKFPGGTPAETTVLEQMRNPYASPLRGKPVVLSGQVIGRGVPGFIFGADMMYQDSTGLVFLNYSSVFGFIGNIFFALKKIKTLFGVPSRAAGWFYRGVGSMISLKYIQTEQEKVRSHPILWSSLLPVILIIYSSFYLYFVIGNDYHYYLKFGKEIKSTETTLAWYIYDGGEFIIEYPNTWRTAKGEGIFKVFIIGSAEKGEPKVAVAQEGERLDISLDEFIPIILNRMRVTHLGLEIIKTKKSDQGVSGHEFEFTYIDTTQITTPRTHVLQKIMLHPVTNRPYLVTGLVEDGLWYNYSETFHRIITSFAFK